MTALRKFIGILFVWTIVLGLGAGAYKFIVLDPTGPTRPSGKSTGASVAIKPTTPDTTPVDPRVKRRYKLAIDSFSGYGIFRSDEFKEKLAAQGIALDPEDDKANYGKRMETVQSGATPLAVFTIDALITNSPPKGECPATIVMVIDETRGADAMVAFKQALPNIDALNSPDVKIALTPDSPSEMLTRVVRSQFNLPNLGKDFLVKPKGVEDEGAEAVYKELLKTPPTSRKAFVLWEPFVSQALQNPKIHVLVDSSRFKGYIVDVLVANREFLKTHKDDVKTIVRAYLDVLNEKQQDAKGMVNLVVSDSEKVGEKLRPDLAEKVAKGIWWKNTMENYGHFGILTTEESKGLQHLSDMIRNIISVLNRTKAPGTRDVELERPDRLYNDEVLRELYNTGPGFHVKQQKIREEPVAPAIQPDQWTQLQKVGTLDVPPIEFLRGGGKLVGNAETELDNLAELLRIWPEYYLRVEGNAKKEGDPDANRKLAETRARAVQDYLTQKGVTPHRIQASSSPPGMSKEVTFVVLQNPQKK